MSEHPRRRALVIGVGDYPVLRHPGLARTVASAAADARAFRDWLIHGRCLDRSCDRRLSPDEVLFHLSPAAPDARPCTRDAIRASVREILDDPPKTELFVYFSGHGFAVRDRVVGPAVDHLVLEDFESLAMSGDNLIHVPYLLRLLSACGPGIQYFFIDACRNQAVQGAIEGGYLGGLNFPPSAAGAPDQLRMFSTRDGAQAAGQSLFSPLLLRGLRGEGSAKQWHVRADGVEELAVRFDSVFQFVKAEMARAPTPQTPVADRSVGDTDIIDAIYPLPLLRCTVAFTPAEAAEGSTVTARLRGAVAGTARVTRGQAELELVPEHYLIMPSGTERLFRPAHRREPIWDARALGPFEAFVANPDPAVRSPGMLDLLFSASPLDRDIYEAVMRGEGVHRGGLESLDPGAGGARSLVDQIVAQPAHLSVVVPDRAIALTCRVETRSGRAMPADPRGRGSAIAFQLPPDLYRLRLRQYGAEIHDQEIDAPPGEDLRVEPARGLARDELRRHILDVCGSEGGGLATPEGPVLDGDLALWVPWWVCATGTLDRMFHPITDDRPFAARSIEAAAREVRRPWIRWFDNKQRNEAYLKQRKEAFRAAERTPFIVPNQLASQGSHERILVAAVTRRSIAASYVADASGQRRSAPSFMNRSLDRYTMRALVPLVFEEFDSGYTLALRGESFDDDARWVIVDPSGGNGDRGATGFAISKVPGHATLLVLVDGPDGELCGFLHHLPMLRDPEPEEHWLALSCDPEHEEGWLAWWLALRVGALAQRALRDRRRVDLAALLTGVDLGELARTSPVAATALRVLAVRQADRALVARLDELRASPVLPAEPEPPVFLDAVPDPQQLELPPGAQLRWDSPLVSFTLPRTSDPPDGDPEVIR